MRTASWMVVAVLAAPRLAGGADFEGVLDAKITGRTSGTSRTWVSKEGIRSASELQMPQAEQAGLGKTLRTTTIVKAAEPDRTYLLDDTRKTYVVVEATDDAGDEGNYQVKRVGTDTVAGYACEKVAITSPSGGASEMCVAKDLAAGDSVFRVFQRRDRGKASGLHKALLDAGVKGLPIRWRIEPKSGREGFAIELVSAKKQRVPASTFEIPAGYTKTESMMPAMSPEAASKLDEAMKNMSPEQRKKMEEMMKRLQGGK